MSQDPLNMEYRPRLIEDPRFSPGQLPFIAQLGPVPDAWTTVHGQHPCAVLCLLIAKSDEQAASVLLTRRSHLVRAHKGQIGFPGGRAESVDLNPSVTALRESFEEVGLEPDQVQIHGSLPHVRGLDSQLLVPILGTAPISTHELTANDEVAQIIALPCTEFTNDRARSFGFTMFGKRRESILYESKPFKIWGLTAKMLSNAGFSHKGP